MRLTPDSFGPLAPHLLDLAAAFGERGLDLTLVGGFGLVLRRQWREELGEATLIGAVPAARATEDFDVLLNLELLESPGQRSAVREALASAGYETQLAYLHFVKPNSGGPGRRDVKVDFLSPPPAGNPSLKVNSMRVGPRRSGSGNELHGYATPEAALMVGEPLRIALEGEGMEGVERSGHVILPHPFLLILMKLCAFRDEFEGRRRNGQVRRDVAAKHLTDVYTLVALLTSTEADGLPELVKQHEDHELVRDARVIVMELLAGETQPGTLLLRETLEIEPEDLQIFLEMLGDAYVKP